MELRQKARELIDNKYTKLVSLLGGLATLAAAGIYLHESLHPNFDLSTGGLAVGATLVFHGINRARERRPLPEEPES
jgi:hypothetical protein